MQNFSLFAIDSSLQCIAADVILPVNLSSRTESGGVWDVIIKHSCIFQAEACIYVIA